MPPNDAFRPSGLQWAAHPYFLLFLALVCGVGSYFSWKEHQEISQLLVDLTEGEKIPATFRSSPRPIRLQGYFSPAWSIDEYAVQAGERPDQNNAPRAYLHPFVNVPPPAKDESKTSKAESAPQHAAKKNAESPSFVVVRLEASSSDLEFEKKTLLAGELRPLDPSLFRSLAASENDKQSSSHQLEDAWLLDTMRKPFSQKTSALALLSLMFCIASLFMYKRAGQ